MGIEESIANYACAAPRDEVPNEVQRVMSDSLDMLRQHRSDGSLRRPDGKHSEQVLQSLARSGYWGLLVERNYGGSGCGLRHFLPFLTQAATIDPPLAGLAAVHGCIGAVDPLQTFGTAEQKQKYLPPLARGERLSAFASTEPGAGSDLQAVKTTAVRTTTGLLISGRKAFITNLAPGRTIGLLCRVDDRPAVCVVELPDKVSEQFQLVPNPLHPLRHTINQGMLLQDFAVPLDAIITPPPGKDGRAIVFHGLNRGKAAISALAAGHLRQLLGGMLTWARTRRVRGQPLAELELIQARCARVAALIAGCDALAAWCGRLLDADERGEHECIIAKVFASEAVKHAAVNLALPTHGGRFFLRGHAAGDMTYDYLAPCIYEGENDLLRLALAHSLSKSGRESSAAASTTRWQEVRPDTTQPELIEMAREVELLTVRGVVQAAITNCPNWEWKQAAEILCEQLSRQLTGTRPTSDEHRAEVALGKALFTAELPSLGDVPEYVDPLP